MCVSVHNPLLSFPRSAPAYPVEWPKVINFMYYYYIYIKLQQNFQQPIIIVSFRTFLLKKYYVCTCENLSSDNYNASSIYLHEI